MSRLFRSLALATIAAVPARAAEPWAFVCEGPSGRLRVRLGAETREARWQERADDASWPERVWALEPPTLSSTLPFHVPGWLVYSTKGAPPAVLATRARVVEERTTTDLLFRVHGEPLRFDRCWKQTAATPVTPQDGSKIGEWLRLDLAAFAMRPDGRLLPEATEAFVSAARAAVPCPVLKPSLLRLGQESVATVTRLLASEPAAAAWARCLEETRHRYSPETPRYAAWAAEGLRRLLGADRGETSVALVLAGTRAFLGSSAAQSLDLRRTFLAETSPLVARLDTESGEKLMTAFSPDEAAWVLRPWLSSPAAAPFRDTTEVDRRARRFAELLAQALTRPQSLDFTFAQRELTLFLKRPDSPGGFNARRFGEQVGPALIRLTETERRALQEWLSLPERQAVERWEQAALQRVKR